MDYKEKLKNFNSTEKYIQEITFLKNLMSPAPHDTILDYGCGTGTCLKFVQQETGVRIHGYDIDCYVEPPVPAWFQVNIKGVYEKIYFMHSLAHIPNILEVLQRLKNHLQENGKTYVITPNAAWDQDARIKSTTYKPDPTVFKHYTAEELVQLFENAGYKVMMVGQFGKIIGGVHERIFLEAIKAD